MKFFKCIPEILSNTAAIREDNPTEIDSVIKLLKMHLDCDRFVVPAEVS